MSVLIVSGLHLDHWHAAETLLMAWMPPPDGIAMCHYDEC